MVAPYADPETGILDDVVDLDRYPIDRPGQDDWTNAVDRVSDTLATTGFAQLPGFLRRDAIDELSAEFARLRRHVPVTADERTPYSTDAGTDPSSRTSSWVAGHITRDMIPPQSPAQRVYVAPGFKQFIAACLGRDRVFEYADPLAGLIATVLPPGGQYGWHYDTTEFVVTITIAAATAGGAFQYVPDLRTPGDENLDGMHRVLDGDHTEVNTVTSEPGDLQLFLGRYSLHRVSEVGAGDDRLSLVLAYADRPGVIGPLDRTRHVYGRVTEAHLVAARGLAGTTTTATDGLVF